jgi:hypothetical protein
LRGSKEIKRESEKENILNFTQK